MNRGLRDMLGRYSPTTPMQWQRAFREVAQELALLGFWRSRTDGEGALNEYRIILSDITERVAAWRSCPGYTRLSTAARSTAGWN